MLGSHRSVSEPMAARQAQRGGRPGRKAVLPSARSTADAGPLATLALVLGYFLLVAILTMAPYWQQTIAPLPEQPPAHTDFGGSR